MDDSLTDMLAAQRYPQASRYERMHFGIIRFVHEFLYGFFVNPQGRLTKAGLKRGQQVLEVGCGPGFFTVPAAKIVGETGHVYALDINPAAVGHVRRKIVQEGLSNVDVELADASQTGFPEESLDLAFLFGVLHAFKDVVKVLEEMHRVLKVNAILSVQSRLPEEKLLEIVTANGLFRFKKEAKGIFMFEKEI